MVCVWGVVFLLLFFVCLFVCLFFVVVVVVVVVFEGGCWRNFNNIKR